MEDGGAPTIEQGPPEDGESMFFILIEDQADNFYVGYFTQSNERGNPLPLFRINARTGKGEYLGDG